MPDPEIPPPPRLLIRPRIPIRKHDPRHNPREPHARGRHGKPHAGDKQRDQERRLGFDEVGVRPHRAVELVFFARGGGFGGGGVGVWVRDFGGGAEGADVRAMPEVEGCGGGCGEEDVAKGGRGG